MTYDNPKGSLLRRDLGVRTEHDERLWEMAKERAAAQGRPKDWPYVMGIFKHMKQRTGSRPVENPDELRANGFFDFFRSKPQPAPSAAPSAAPAPRYRKNRKGYFLKNIEVLSKGERTVDLDGEPVVVQHEHIIVDQPDDRGAPWYLSEHLMTLVPYKGERYFASTKRSRHEPTGEITYVSAVFGTRDDGQPDFSLEVAEHKRPDANIDVEHDRLVQEIPEHVEDYLQLRQEWRAAEQEELAREQAEFQPLENPAPARRIKLSPGAFSALEVYVLDPVHLDDAPFDDEGAAVTSRDILVSVVPGGLAAPSADEPQRCWAWHSRLSYAAESAAESGDYPAAKALNALAGKCIDPLR